MNPTRFFASALAGLLGIACADLTAPPSNVKPRGAPGARAETEQARAEPEPEPEPEPAPARPARAQREAVAASHILVSYKGALRAKPDVTRTKEEAKKRAQALLARLEKGTDFAELAKEESDGPSAVRGGALGKFTRDRMVKPFADVAFSLEPGQLGGPVETKFGFHLIKRTE